MSKVRITVANHAHLYMQIALNKSAIPFARLDGSMPMSQRNDVLTAFEESRDCGVLLMSIKAGGVGLNLHFCQYVFLIDPWWNPQRKLCSAHSFCFVMLLVTADHVRAVQLRSKPSPECIA